mgnify:CR=1 FL=1
MKKTEIIQSIINLTISENWKGNKADQERENLRKYWNKESKESCRDQLTQLQEAETEFYNQ